MGDTVYLLMEIWIEEECAACILYGVSIWCVGYASDRLNSGWGVIVALLVLHAALAFIVGFHCCPWSSVRTHSYAKGAAVVFTDGCPSVAPAGSSEDPLLWFTSRIEKKNSE